MVEELSPQTDTKWRWGAIVATVLAFVSQKIQSVEAL